MSDRLTSLIKQRGNAFMCQPQSALSGLIFVDQRERNAPNCARRVSNVHVIRRFLRGCKIVLSGLRNANVIGQRNLQVHAAIIAHRSTSHDLSLQSVVAQRGTGRSHRQPVPTINYHIDSYSGALR